MFENESLIIFACITGAVIALGLLFRSWSGELAALRGRTELRKLGTGVLIAAAVVGVGLYIQDNEERSRRQKQAKETENVLAELKNGRSEQSHSLTMQVFDRIRTGMSYEAVCDLLGGTGTLASSTSIEGLPATELYRWSDGGKVLTCVFQGNALVTKAQAGLR